MKILKNVQRVPGGLMVIPLFLGVLCNTFIPDFLTMGGYLTATFSNGGTNSIMGVFFVAVGAQIRVKQAPEILKRGLHRLGRGVRLGDDRGLRSLHAGHYRRGD